MKQLNMDLLNSNFDFPDDLVAARPSEMPERIIQFGEGNFLRAFVDWMVHEMNKQGLFNGKAVIVQPIPQGRIPELNEQDGLYTLFLRGIQNGKVIEKKEIIHSVSRGINPYTDWKEFLQCAANPDLRFMISNTTEAGIAYVDEEQPIDSCPTSFPAKVTAFLYERYKHFAASPDKGMVIIPCELIDRNGDNLKRIVLRYIENWNLEDSFREWVENSNFFLNTLVDRIVTGYPKDEAEDITAQLGYRDKLLDTGEIFHLWVIEGDKRFNEEIPFTKAGLQVLWTDDMAPYRTRKVRILNGAHTMTVLAAYLYGKDTVGECVEDPVIGEYMKKGIFEEVIPTVELPEEEKQKFAADVFERFGNPFIKHYLLSIALNSVSKFKVRVLPSLLDYVHEKKQLPKILSFSLAALTAFYRGSEMKDGVLLGSRNGEAYPIQDEPDVLEFFAQAWREYSESPDASALTRKVLGQQSFWGQDLNEIDGLTGFVAESLKNILDKGMKKAVQDLIA